jgi:lipopolysaccharide heptosyltransferase I
LSKILFIKTSSLGDVIHNMPAVSEAQARVPGARIAWLVEEAYVPLVRLHPGVADVIPVAARRWRKHPFSSATWREIAERRRAIGAETYDAVIDTQGLLRTGLLSRAARGTRHGYDRRSIREPLAAMFYDVKHAVSRDRHAIERNRLLTGLALGYVPAGPPNYGLDRTRLREGNRPYAVFLHGTAQPDKEWAAQNWIAIGKILHGRGVDIVLPWGNDREHARAAHLAANIAKGRVADAMPLDRMARLIAGAQFVVGVDTGLLHLAAALGVPLFAIFAGSRPELTGPIGQGPIEVMGGKASPPGVNDVAAAIERVVR